MKNQIPRKSSPPLPMPWVGSGPRHDIACKHSISSKGNRKPGLMLRPYIPSKSSGLPLLPPLSSVPLPRVGRRLPSPPFETAVRKSPAQSPTYSPFLLPHRRGPMLRRGRPGRRLLPFARHRLRGPTLTLCVKDGSDLGHFLGRSFETIGHDARPVRLKRLGSFNDELERLRKDFVDILLCLTLRR